METPVVESKKESPLKSLFSRMNRPEKAGRVMIILGAVLMMVAMLNYMQNQDLIHDGMNWRAYKSFDQGCAAQNARTVLSCEFTYFPNQTNDYPMPGQTPKVS